MAQEQSARREGHAYASLPRWGWEGDLLAFLSAPSLLSWQDGVDVVTLGAGPRSTDPPALSLSGTKEAVFCFCRSNFTESGLSLGGGWEVLV